MNTRIGRRCLILGTAGLMLFAGSVLADGPHGGGGHGGGGRGGGGGGRGAAPAHFGGGPARFGGGGPAHFGGGPARFGGGGPARAAVAPHFAAGARYGGAPGRGYAGPHYAPGARYAGAPHYAPGPAQRRQFAAEHGNWNRTGGEGHWDGDRGEGGGQGWGHDRFWSGDDWGGGYWGGGYWPGVSYGVDFAWFLPVLPGVYATYWYDGIPYYYADDVYYTWDPGYSGYVATDPPPVAGNAAPAPGASDQIFMYPKNGQSPAQQAADRRACEQWAADQVGNSYNTADYRRAMTACAEGRGYTVR
ncbi:MAG TPA: hypothetical protein VND80_11105 [Steroidobacteraceae bacterium]|nr:hypothetical protein [Steroidobacteraceae bacterium]